MPAFYEWINPITDQPNGAFPFRTGISVKSSVIFFQIVCQGTRIPGLQCIDRTYFHIRLTLPIYSDHPRIIYRTGRFFFNPDATELSPSIESSTREN